MRRGVTNSGDGDRAELRSIDPQQSVSFPDAANYVHIGVPMFFDQREYARHAVKVVPGSKDDKHKLGPSQESKVERRERTCSAPDTQNACTAEVSENVPSVLGFRRFGNGSCGPPGRAEYNVDCGYNDSALGLLPFGVWSDRECSG